MKRQIWAHKQAAWASNFSSNCQQSRAQGQQLTATVNEIVTLSLTVTGTDTHNQI